MYRKILKIIGLLMAIGLAFIVAFISVTGLMKVFSGVGEIGLYFFIFIEVAKVVTTSLLHTFRKRLNIFIKFAGTIMVLVAMGVTSLGCYGFLSSSYKQSFVKLENTEAEITLLEKRKEGYQEQLDVITNEKTSVNKTITELTKGLSNNVIQYKDPESGEIITTTSSTTRRVLTAQLDKAIDRQSILNTKSDTLSSKIFKLSNNILENKLGNDASNELGPLKYLSDISGMTMDNVMKWFILFLIFIGDPLAVLLVIIYNKVIEDKEEEVKEKKPSFWSRFKKKEPLKATKEEFSPLIPLTERYTKEKVKEPMGPYIHTEGWVDERNLQIPPPTEEPLFNIGEEIEEPPKEIFKENKVEPKEIVNEFEEMPSLGSMVPPIKERLGENYEKEKEKALNHIKESMERQTIVSPPPLTQPSIMDLTKRKEVEVPFFVEEEKPKRKTDFRLKNLKNKEHQYHLLLEESDSNDEVTIPKKEDKKFTFDVVEEDNTKEEEEEVIKPEELIIPPRIGRRKPGSGYMGIRRV